MSPWRRVFVRPLPIAAVWLSLPLWSIAFGTLSIPTHPNDYWYALALGRQFSVTGTLPNANLFLYTVAPDAAYRAQAWLGQWLLYRVFSAGGHRGMSLLLSAAMLVAWGLVVDRALRRKGSARGVGLVATLCVGLTFASFNVRTETFAFPLYAGALWLLFGAADGEIGLRWCLLLAPIAAVWSNLHGSFPLVTVLVGAFGLGVSFEAWRRRDPVLPTFARWSGLGVLTLLAGLVSPFGVGNYENLVRFASFHGVSEWQAPPLTGAKGAFTLVALMLAGLVFVVRRRALRGYEPPLVALTGWLALSANRHDFWFAAALPVALAPHLGALLPDRDPSTPPSQNKIQGKLNAALALLAVGSFIALQPGLLLERARIRATHTAKTSGEGRGLLSRDQPVELVRRACTLITPARRIFHEQRVGGMLEYLCTDPGKPERIAFVDQRMELVPEAVWREYFSIGAASGWRERLARYGIGVLLLEKQEQRPLLDAVSVSGDWATVAEEGDFVLLKRRH